MVRDRGRPESHHRFLDQAGRPHRYPWSGLINQALVQPACGGYHVIEKRFNFVFNMSENGSTRVSIKRIII